MKLYYLLEKGDRIQAGDEFYSLATDCWKPVSDDIEGINEDVCPIRRAVPGIWHLAGELRPPYRDADRTGRVLAIDAGGSLNHISRNLATADHVVAWCRTADFLELCPPPEPTDPFDAFMAREFPDTKKDCERWEELRRVWDAAQAAGKEVAE